ncbi:MAG: hypothetical protein KOO60_07290 [Gemmatimonadales bacterium]|nr:hypothetical protein [Gemmatimonadales bacterium]
MEIKTHHCELCGDRIPDCDVVESSQMPRYILPVPGGIHTRTITIDIIFSVHGQHALPEPVKGNRLAALCKECKMNVMNRYSGVVRDTDAIADLNTQLADAINALRSLARKDKCEQCVNNGKSVDCDCCRCLRDDAAASYRKITGKSAMIGPKGGGDAE